jgi:hypothetical protein
VASTVLSSSPHLQYPPSNISGRPNTLQGSSVSFPLRTRLHAVSSSWAFGLSFNPQPPGGRNVFPSQALFVLLLSSSFYSNHQGPLRSSTVLLRSSDLQLFSSLPGTLNCSLPFFEPSTVLLRSSGPQLISSFPGALNCSLPSFEPSTVLLLSSGLQQRWHFKTFLYSVPCPHRLL